MPMVWVVGELKHRLTVRLGDAHVAQLNALADASGLSRNDVVRRVLLSHQLPTAESLEDIEKLQRLQADQNRLGGLLKKTLTERRDKADIRRTLAEIERTSARIRVVIDRLARARMIIKPKKWKKGRSTSAKRPRFRGLVTYMLKGKGTERCTWYEAGNLEGIDRREDADARNQCGGGVSALEHARQR